MSTTSLDAQMTKLLTLEAQMDEQMERLQAKQVLTDALYAEMQKAAEGLKQLYADRRRDGDRLVKSTALALVGTIVLLALGESFHNILLVHGAVALSFMICTVVWKAAEIFVKRVLLKGKKDE